ncbi:hypothetical protein A2154_04950 [Candidatus Gottesmanbacteria bacterium RBG_16_43_7]|uniref:Prepilin peptidase n=1 Tax=Candidatus Gottesmanbacteria bacterium RBG_16_43_7 TaxID=1798373 RepID=A0A1F5ZCK9_9BACT|nr:MAG: hypothetical protein A2154_04950 [Candidatus Gottesmanbacteria bacterium RBG_16_43_7]
MLQISIEDNIMVFLYFIFGLFFGSFFNVLIERLPKAETVLGGRSHCDYCKRTLAWYELIPLLSYLAQGGRCRHCRRALSWQYFITEFACGIMFTAVGYFLVDFTLPNILMSVLASAVLSALFVIFFTDFKYMIVPDVMVFIGIVCIVLYRFLGTGWFAGSFYQEFPIPAAAVGNWLITSVGSVLAFYSLWAVTKGRGLGLGDVKLVGLLGAIVAYPLVIFSFYTAFLTGAIVGVILIIAKRKRFKSEIAFGPFLIWGTFLVLLFQNTFIRWWKGVI